MSGRESRWRALVVCVVVLGAGAAAIAWLVHERDGASLESKLRAMSPEVVGSPPTVKWHRRLICQGEKLAVMCVGDAGATGGDAYYLKTTINRANGEAETLPGGRTTIRVTLGKAGGEWVVTHFSIV